MKIKKSFLLLLVVALVVIGGGIVWKLKNRGFSSEKTEEKKEVVEEKVKEGLRDWLMKKTGVECQLTTEDGTIKVIAKGNKFKIEGQKVPLNGEEKPGMMINDGEWVYIWAGEEGIKYKIEKKEGENEEGATTETDFSLEKLEKEWERYQYRCKAKRVADSEFVPPAGVNFVNLSSFTTH
ncbi:hypothetical protein J7J95_00090 [bacterium]|nr:hypothetical protein [bacterium]